MTSPRDPATVVDEAMAWKNRKTSMRSRSEAALQREAAAGGREEAAAGRGQASALRAQAAQLRDEGALSRDDAAAVRDAAALVCEQAAQARDSATTTRETASRLRLLESAPGSRAWEELLELDRVAVEQSHQAVVHDREAAHLHREAAEKDRHAAKVDRDAAHSDRLAADKDGLAADKDRAAAEADRAAADADRAACQQDLGLAEERLTRADRLAAMGRLAAGIAHELNNPLSALLNTLAVIELEQCDGNPPFDLNSLVADARLAAERIAHVVADMKTWLYGGDEQPAQCLDLQRLVDDSLRLTTVQLHDKARVVVALEPTPAVWGVPARISQVLINLILNAANAMSGPKDDNELRISARSDGDTVTLEAGRLRIEEGSVDVPALVAQSVGLLRATAAAKGLSLEVQVEPEGSLWVAGDRGRLGQVLTNLLSNAVKFTERGRILVHAKVADGVLSLRVADTGVGLSAAQQERLFQPFTQLDESATRRYGGAGLGLSLSRQLARLMGGDLTLQSAPGRGSTFTCTVPAPVIEASVPRPREALITDLSSLRVLVVEDNKVNQLLATSLLRKAGASSEVVENGRLALERLDRGPTDFDVVLMDMQMPELDGLETTRAMRRQARFEKTPIIALTAHALEEERERCLAAGMNAYLSKPIQVAAFYAALRQYVRSSPAG